VQQAPESAVPPHLFWGSGSGSGSGSGGGPSTWSDAKDSFTSMGRYGAWGDDNEGWQTTSSVGAGLGTAGQVVAPAGLLAGMVVLGRGQLQGSQNRHSAWKF